MKRKIFALGTYRIKGSVRGIAPDVTITAFPTKDTLNVRGFGASPDRDDNTAFFQGALDYAAAGRLRRVVLRLRGRGPRGRGWET